MARTLYVDSELLDEYIKLNGIKYDYIAKEMGISRNAFYRKRKGLTPFRKSEVYLLVNMLNIVGDDKAKIFYPTS